MKGLIYYSCMDNKLNILKKVIKVIKNKTNIFIDDNNNNKFIIKYKIIIKHKSNNI